VSITLILHILWWFLPFVVSGIMGTALLLFFRLLAAGIGDLFDKHTGSGICKLIYAIITLMIVAVSGAFLFWLLLVIIGPEH
jgi:hypothetical protein